MSERKSVDSVSHGRGGAGNIGADDTPYADAEIVRLGTPGDHGDGPFSSGRGGQGNILTNPKPADVERRNDQELIPDLALRHAEETDHHVGRGGQGNVVRMKSHEGEEHPVGLADRLKGMIPGIGKKKEKKHVEGENVQPKK